MIPENFLIRNDGSNNFLQYLEWLNLEKKSTYWIKSITQEYIGHYYGCINGATLCLKRTDNIAVDIYTKGKNVLWLDDVNDFLKLLRQSNESSMTTQEIAKSIIDSFERELKSENSDRSQEAKNCAVIMIDKIINIAEDTNNYFLKILYQKIKEEIQNGLY